MKKDGYTWMQDEKLVDLIKPERLNKIKLDAIKNTEKSLINKKSPYLLDKLVEQNLLDVLIVLFKN